MKHILSNRWFLLALRVILGGVFVYAGAVKIQQPQAFADSIASFQLLPDAVINLFALGLPPLEIITGLMVLIGWKLRLASFTLLLLSLLFAVALGQAVVRGLVVDCGCFGSGKPSLLKNWFSLGRDILVITASAWLYLRMSICGP